MDYQTIKNRCYAELPAHISARTETFVSKLEEVFGSANGANFNDTSVLPSIFYLTSSKLGKSNFYHIKRMLKLFYNELYSEGLASKETVEYLDKLSLADVVTDGEVRTSFFKDLRSAISFIRTVGHGNMYNDNELLVYKAIIIMAWYGIDEPQDVKKIDVRNNSIELPGRKPIKLNPDEYAILAAYRDATEYRGFPTPRMFTFLPSEWMFRGLKSDHLTKHNLRSLMACFNDYAVDYGKVITIASMSLNGLFDYIRTHRNNKSVAVQIHNLLGCTRQSSFAYEKTYNKWLEIYWNAEVK